MALTSITGGRARRSAATILCAALLGMLGLAATAPAAGATEAGVNISNLSSQQIADVRALGGHWVRMFINWRSMEPQPGGIASATEAGYEAGFRALPVGTKVILDVVDSPEWASGSPDEHTPPANPQDYADFVAALAARFAPWVKAYEIWNEEDAPIWWTGAPNAAAYTALLKAAYPAIKAADPSATVVVGGLTGNDYSFMEGIYAAGGKGYFDAVGVHTDTACNLRSPYEFVREPNRRLIPDAFLAYREVHDVMVANGDAKPIWMTEMSWRTTTAECEEGLFAGQKAGGVSDEQQASFLREAYHCLEQSPYVQMALWFPLIDEGAVTSGLIREDGSHKPSYEAMQAFIRHGDKLKEECGDFAGPSIRVSSPSNRFVYSGPLPIHVSARSSQGVFRIRLEIDGKLIRNYDGDSDPTVLYGSLDWQGAKHIPFGRHTLTFLAYTKEMNISQRSITIVHVHPPKRRHRH